MKQKASLKKRDRIIAEVIGATGKLHDYISETEYPRFTRAQLSSLSDSVSLINKLSGNIVRYHLKGDSDA